MKKLGKILITTSAIILSACASAPDTPKSERLAGVKARATAPLSEQLAAKNLRLGSPVFIRIFKETSEFELWVKSGETFTLFKTYPICKYSGRLGPKLKEGDKQAPEGIYWVGATQLNPQSDYHLSFNLGFPNKYDLANGRTGSFLMVHGACGSVGCYAMTDPLIEEIYLLVDAALARGQEKVQVHALPFRMSQNKLDENVNNEWIGFWRQIADIDREFENNMKVPKVKVVGQNYVLDGQISY